MGAKTPFFVCGKCGFENHPRLNQDLTKCEQCGASSEDENAADYVPTQRR